VIDLDEVLKLLTKERKRRFAVTNKGKASAFMKKQYASLKRCFLHWVPSLASIKSLGRHLLKKRGPNTETAVSNITIGPDTASRVLT
jgi:hypothetical protein